MLGDIIIKAVFSRDQRTGIARAPSFLQFFDPVPLQVYAMAVLVVSGSLPDLAKLTVAQTRHVLEGISTGKETGKALEFSKLEYGDKYKASLEGIQTMEKERPEKFEALLRQREDLFLRGK